ncbi:MAG: protein CrcB [Acidobacteria bacterium RIFCSPLOWO2_12_FULL_54_10]|nr:MAG: protein CrcB [Acidobacteria bacterium RIFCSPLOWO2_12_FULL_54_10]
MDPYLIIAFGSALGGALRHGVNVTSARLLGDGWPYGTLIVNVAGSFAMGLIAEYFALKGQAPQAWRLFLTTGILGGFTTFSAFSLDIALFYERGQWASALIYAGSSVIISIIALFAGLSLIRHL